MGGRYLPHRVIGVLLLNAGINPALSHLNTSVYCIPGPLMTMHVVRTDDLIQDALALYNKDTLLSVPGPAGDSAHAGIDPGSFSNVECQVQNGFRELNGGVSQWT
jgi:hypothetical protein